MTADLEKLGLDELMDLRDRLSDALVRRFERGMALAFTDIVGSTEYFARFGDEAGRGLQQRHFDLLARVTGDRGGRIVDTAGDGAFLCFPTVIPAAQALIELQHLLAASNLTRSPEHHLTVRAGIHFAPVLTDGVTVTGDGVNLCARVTATARAQEIRLTRPAAAELDERLRARLRPLPRVQLKGIAQPTELVALEWRDHLVPTSVRIKETGERIPLPDKTTITFGRLREHDGAQANDVVLWVPNREDLAKISRWHFELRRQTDGLHLRPVSDQVTEVDGVHVDKGNTRPVSLGSVVRLADGAVTLSFEADDAGAGESGPAV